MVNVTTRRTTQRPTREPTRNPRSRNRDGHLGPRHGRVHGLPSPSYPTAYLTQHRKFPSAHIIGTDIDPIQPSWTLPNLEFIIENFEDEWLYKKNHFDYIHARLLAMCVADWPLLIRRMYEHTKPGGYCEHQESAIWAWSDDGSLTYDSPVFQHVQALDTAARLTGRELNIYYKLRGWMIDAGFEDVKEYTYFLPYSPWPRDPHLKELGKYQAVMAQQAVESYGLRLCTQVLGWGVEPSKIFQAMVKRHLRDKHLHAYLKVYVPPLHFSFSDIFRTLLSGRLIVPC